MKLRIASSIPALSENRVLCTDALETSSDLSLSAVEIKLGRDGLVSQDMRGWLADALGGYGFKPYCHLPYLHGEVNIASPDASLGSAAVAIMLESIEYAARIGCDTVNTHIGVALGNGPHIPRAAKRLESMAAQSTDLGITICVENQEASCRGILNGPEDFGTLIDLSEDIALTYDPGHGNTHGYGVQAFLPIVLSNLAYLHLHDNSGRSDEHLALGQGNIDFALLLAGLAGHRFHPKELPATLELSLRDLEPSREYLRKAAGSGLELV